ncbi:MAG: hypothetical protein QOH82_670 [Mycobacterium sp.]|nr:hypothetical protein [Mycobacterium sp.]
MPDTMVDPKVINAAVELACRAPSLHNSQPWRWVSDSAGLHLFADPTRKVQVADPSGREALISCGAVLDHLRVAMAAAGWSAHVDRFPNPNNLKHVASIDFRTMDFVTDGQRERADAILRRRTDRLPLAEPTNWTAFEYALRNTMCDAAVRLDVLTNVVRPELAEASRISTTLRLYDSSYHAELEWWTSNIGSSEGIPRSALVSATERERVDLERAFPVADPQERRAAIDQDRARILALSTDADSREDAVRCGEALSTVLLECTLAGMATCTLTHITEFPAGRGVIAALIGTSAFPQLLIRVGEAPAIEQAPPATGRRPLKDVLAWRAPPSSRRLRSGRDQSQLIGD